MINRIFAICHRAAIVAIIVLWWAVYLAVAYDHKKDVWNMIDSGDYAGAFGTGIGQWIACAVFAGVLYFIVRVIGAVVRWVFDVPKSV